LDKQRAIELLKQKSKEAVHIASRHYYNNEYIPWRRNIEDILESAFGVTSTEYKRIVDIPSKTLKGTYAEKRRGYVRFIHRIQQEVNSIIQKHEVFEVETEPSNLPKTPPKAFIAHGGRSGVLDKLREFIEALGIEPVIVELSPSRGMTVDAKVNTYIKDADCGIVLARKGGIVDTTGTTPKQHPRLNVIDELERLRAAFPEKTILLVERGVDLPSNVSGLTYEPFVGQSMDRAFTAIARELTAFGILKTVKP